jgi:light-regulated signal transduction histidine kinase (bacteriophytochrome)
MLKATSRMQTLIDNLLTLSQVATKGRPFAPTNLSEILEEVISDLETRINLTGGIIKADLLPTIEADPIQMHQLLQNLISNGLKFHRQDVPPVIKLSAKLPVNRSGQKHLYNDGYCEIIVEDNGIGFEKKYAARIFQPFQRLHGHYTYEGTGMGLAICQRIAERHGGRITVKSIPNEGSTFAVMLPVNQAKEKFETGIQQ